MFLEITCLFIVVFIVCVWMNWVHRATRGRILDRIFLAFGVVTECEGFDLERGFVQQRRREYGPIVCDRKRGVIIPGEKMRMRHKGKDKNTDEDDADVETVEKKQKLPELLEIEMVFLELDTIPDGKLEVQHRSRRVTSIARKFDTGALDKHVLIFEPFDHKKAAEHGINGTHRWTIKGTHEKTEWLEAPQFSLAMVSLRRHSLFAWDSDDEEQDDYEFDSPYELSASSGSYTIESVRLLMDETDHKPIVASTYQ